MLIKVKFIINKKPYHGYINYDAQFTQRPLLEYEEALRLMQDINATFEMAEMIYDEKQDNFYDDYRCFDEHTGKDYETKDGIKHLYDFADEYFSDWEARITFTGADYIGE